MKNVSEIRILQKDCHGGAYGATMTESLIHPRAETVFQRWKELRQILGDGNDFFSEAFGENRVLEFIYLKNAEVDKPSDLAKALNLPKELRWDDMDGNWLQFRTNYEGREVSCFPEGFRCVTLTLLSMNMIVYPGS